MTDVLAPARSRRRIATSANTAASRSACLWECPTTVRGKPDFQKILIRHTPTQTNAPCWKRNTYSRGNIHVASSAIRYGRMPEAERKKLVAGLLAEENVGKPGCSDLKSLAKQVNSAYLKNLSMTKKRARSILAGKTSSTSVRTPSRPWHC